MKKNFINYYNNFLRIITSIIGIINLLDNKYATVFAAISFIALSYLPHVINKKYKIHMDNLLLFLYTTFNLFAVFCGGGLNWYKVYYWWDIVVHLSSGIFFFYLGLFICNLIKIQKKYKLFIVLLFVSFFALLWEVWEFILDTIFKTEFQEWKVMNKEPFTRYVKERGHGLVDSMMDMIYALVGYFISLSLYIKIKKKTLK